MDGGLPCEPVTGWRYRGDLAFYLAKWFVLGTVLFFGVNSLAPDFLRAAAIRSGPIAAIKARWCWVEGVGKTDFGDSYDCSCPLLLATLYEIRVPRYGTARNHVLGTVFLYLFWLAAVFTGGMRWFWYCLLRRAGEHRAHSIGENGPLARQGPAA